MKKSVFAIAIAAALGTTTLSAQELNYDYIEVGYTAMDADGLEVDGIGANFSVSLTDDIFLISSIQDLESDEIFGAKLDLQTYSVGLGYRAGLSDVTDATFSASWMRGEIDGNNFGLGSYSGTGYDLSVGLRHLLAPQLELAGNVTYSDFEGADGTGLEIGALYHITPVISVGVGYNVADESDGWKAGVRLNF
ncbi:MAG: outer membrane beta-barrel protein [Pseudohongiella sp.]|uniref:outer membrane beta-barrel protein n=1 Tax=Pseudohongiella sp. TaxID=1979412 RepID=UPI0034A08C2F